MTGDYLVKRALIRFQKHKVSYRSPDLEPRCSDLGVLTNSRSHNFDTDFHLTYLLHAIREQRKLTTLN